MKKRVLALVVMAIMVMASVMSVSAANSIVVKPTVSESQKPTGTGSEAKGYEIRTGEKQFHIDDTAEASKIKDAVVAYNGGDKDIEKMIDKCPTSDANKKAELKAAVKDMKALTEVFDLHDVNGGKPVNGKHVVTLSVPGLTEKHTKVVALHYSNVDHEWEVISGDKVVVDHKKDTVTVTFDDLSPVMILANEAIVSDTDTKLPQTAGVSSAWMLWTAMALIVVGAGVVVSQKKSR